MKRDFITLPDAICYKRDGGFSEKSGSVESGPRASTTLVRATFARLFSNFSRHADETSALVVGGRVLRTR
jgi:hypothetical protein